MDIELLRAEEHDDIESGLSCIIQNSVADTYHLHTHDFFELFYVSGGRALHNLNGKSEIVSYGTLEFILPTDAHEYQPLDLYDMKLISIAIKRDLMLEILDALGWEESSLSRNFTRVFSISEREGIANMLSHIKEITDLQKRRSYGKMLIGTLLHILTDETDNAKRKIPEWLAILLDKMSLPENFTVGLPRMIELSHVSQAYLNRSMRKYLDMTPTEFLNLKKISYAATLLLEGKYPIGVLSTMCGFETQSNFYMNFKRAYACSPSEFIKRNSKQ